MQHAIEDTLATAKMSADACLLLHPLAGEILEIEGVDPAVGVSLDHLDLIGCQGTRLLGDGDLAQVPAGLWLARLAEQTREQTVFERFILPDGACIDAIGAAGEFRFRHCPMDEVSRLIRHDLSNQLNSIKVNAELTRLLAQRAGEDKIESAAQRILDDCERATQFSRQALPSLMSTCPNSYDVQSALTELFGVYAANEAEDIGDVSIEVITPPKAKVPDPWLHTVGGFLRRIALSLHRPPTIIQNQDPQATTITVVATSNAELSGQGFIKLVEAEWQRGRSLTGSLSSLSAAAGPFSLAVQPNWLRFRGSLPYAR